MSITQARRSDSKAWPCAILPPTGEGHLILVTGASGFVGRHLVAHLLAQGLAVRCLVPPERDVSLLMPAGLPAPELAGGHLLDEESLFRAVTGVHVIFHLASAQWWGRTRDLQRYELAGTRNLVRAARAARVGRIVLLSHLGAARTAAWPLLRVKGMVEEIIRQGGLAWTIVRSGLVFGEDDSFINALALSLRANPFFFLMPGRGEIVLQPIHVDDLVSALAACLQRLQLVDTLVEIGGPEYISLRDLLRTVMRVWHMPRFVISVPPWLLRRMAVLYSRLLPRVMLTPQLLDLLAISRVTQIGNTWSYFGVRPRRLEDSLLGWQQRYGWRELLRATLRPRPRGIPG